MEQPPVPRNLPIAHRIRVYFAQEEQVHPKLVGHPGSKCFCTNFFYPCISHILRDSIKNKYRKKKESNQRGEEWTLLCPCWRVRMYALQKKLVMPAELAAFLFPQSEGQ